MKFFHRLHTQFRKKELDQELSEELAFHIEKETEENIGAGMSAEDAHFAALRKFGGIDQVIEEWRDAWGVRFIESLLQDLRFGWRMLWKSPGFTAVAVLTIALGIGGAGAVFSVVNGVLLKPLPYDRSGDLMAIREGTSKAPSGYWIPLSPADANEIQVHTNAFEQVVMAMISLESLTGVGQPDEIWVWNVSANFFATLSAKPILGRTFSREEVEAENGSVVVISYGLWNRLFGADKTVVGRSIRLNGNSYTVVGVMPAGFHYSKAEAWLPLGLTPAQLQDRSHHNLEVIAKRRSGIGITKAQADLAQLANRLARDYPETDSGCSFQVVPLLDEVVGNVRPGLIMLQVAACFLLLIACSNVASLLLARATRRRREMAVRVAVGAGRWRLFQQLFVESLLLSLLGGSLALPLAAWLIEVLRVLHPTSVPRLEEVNLDSHVLLFVLGVSVLTSVAFGTMPAVQASNCEFHSRLKERGAIGSSVGRRLHLQWRSLLVAFEVALSLVSLIGASLLLNSFIKLTSVPLGFEPKNVLSAAIVLPRSKYKDPSAQAFFFNQIMQRMQGLQPFQAFALVNIPPLMGAYDMTAWSPVNTSEPLPLPPADFQIITPDYFRVVGIRLIKGRFFSSDDYKGAAEVAIINNSMARQYWPNSGPLGAQVRVNWRRNLSPLCTIVGIVDDARYVSPERPMQPEIYVPLSQFPIPIMHILVRTPGDPLKLTGLVRERVASVDNNQPISYVTTLEDRLSESMAAPQFNSFLLGMFAALGLTLTVVGIYGLISYLVAERTHEIGIRMALGAGRMEVLTLIISQGFRLALIGVASGILGALALTRFLASLLYGVKPTDPLTFVVVPSVLIAIALIATYIPARRATKVDPMVALRYE